MAHTGTRFVSTSFRISCQPARLTGFCCERFLTLAGNRSVHVPLLKCEPEPRHKQVSLSSLGPAFQFLRTDSACPQAAESLIIQP